MPNWFMGTLTVRGKRSDIVDFTQNAFTKVEGGFLYIEGTDRGFVCGEGVQGPINDLPDVHEKNFSVQFGWSVKSEQIRQLSSQYPLTFEITGSESMINFAQHVLAKDGVLLIDEETDLDTMEVQSFV